MFNLELKSDPIDGDSLDSKGFKYQFENLKLGLQIV